MSESWINRLSAPLIAFALTVGASVSTVHAVGDARKVRSCARAGDTHAAAPLRRVLRCSLITNHPNGRRVSVHWFAGVLQSLCSLS